MPKCNFCGTFNRLEENQSEEVVLCYKCGKNMLGSYDKKKRRPSSHSEVESLEESLGESEIERDEEETSEDYLKKVMKNQEKGVAGQDSNVSEEFKEDSEGDEEFEEDFEEDGVFPWKTVGLVGLGISLILGGLLFFTDFGFSSGEVEFGEGIEGNSQEILGENSENGGVFQISVDMLLQEGVSMGDSVESMLEKYPNMFAMSDSGNHYGLFDGGLKLGLKISEDEVTYLSEVGKIFYYFDENYQLYGVEYGLKSLDLSVVEEISEIYEGVEHSEETYLWDCGDGFAGFSERELFLYVGVEEEQVRSILG